MVFQPHSLSTQNSDFLGGVEVSLRFMFFSKTNLECYFHDISIYFTDILIINLFPNLQYDTISKVTVFIYTLLNQTTGILVFPWSPQG